MAQLDVPTLDDANAASGGEPVRVPLWAVTPLVVIVTLALDLLTGVDLRDALAGMLVAVLGYLGAGEVARKRAWSPRSVRRIVQQQR